MDLLANAAVSHAVWPVDVDETPLPGEQPEALVARLSQAKVAAAIPKCPPGSPILAADTIVAVDNMLLGKAQHAGAARQMLELLSGKTHLVLTGYCLRWFEPSGEERQKVAVVTTQVCVRPLTDDEIHGYLACEEWRGKAGSYAIQGRFSTFVQRISGSYENVVGLPLCAVVCDLKQARILPADWPKFEARRPL